jgi:hypothetical protein
VDALLKLAWIEWHPFGVVSPKAEQKRLENTLACPVKEWRW